MGFGRNLADPDTVKITFQQNLQNQLPRFIADRRKGAAALLETFSDEPDSFFTFPLIRFHSRVTSGSSRGTER